MLGWDPPIALRCAISYRWAVDVWSGNFLLIRPQSFFGSQGTRVNQMKSLRPGWAPS